MPGTGSEVRCHCVCLQELKASDEKFPEFELLKAGYGAIWHGQRQWNGVAILARGSKPVETRRGLPRDPDDTHSRYLEAAVDGLIIGCFTCRIAIGHLVRNSITSWHGSSAYGNTQRHWFHRTSQ